MAKAAKAKPTKAKTFEEISVPKKELHLAEARLWTDRNRIEGSFPLFARAALDKIYIDGKDRSYVAHIRSATFALNLKNIEDDPSKGTYSRASAKGVKTHAITETKTKGASVRAKMTARLTGASAEAGGSIDNKTKDKTTVKTETKIPVVAYTSNCKWSLGHAEHGDPDQDGFLKGDYFSASEPICHVRMLAGKKTAQIDAVISVRRSEILIVREEQYRDEKEISQGEEPDAVGALMLKLTELRLMKDVVPTGTFVIAKDCLLLEPAKDD